MQYDSIHDYDDDVVYVDMLYCSTIVVWVRRVVCKALDSCCTTFTRVFDDSGCHRFVYLDRVLLPAKKSAACVA